MILPLPITLYIWFALKEDEVVLSPKFQLKITLLLFVLVFVNVIVVPEQALSGVKEKLVDADGIIIIFILSCYRLQ